MRNRILLSLLFVAAASAQQAGDLTQEYHPPLLIQTCDNSGCHDEQAYVVIDEDYRYIYSVNDHQNCLQNDGSFNPQYCPDGKTCAENCALDGVDQNGYQNTYGITTNGRTLTLNYVTKHDGTETIGSRVYLLTDENNYRMFNLKNRELAVDIDISTLTCGMNGDVYFIEMQKDGGTSSYGTQKAGAKFGTGYCDAQCPTYIKFIAGEANIDNKYGICCTEMDLFETNSASHSYTTHGCNKPGYYPCLPDDCGITDRHKGVCDMDGCEYNAYRLNNHEFYGHNSTFDVDTSQPLTIITQFVTQDNSDNGELSEIRHVYVQNGQVIQNAKANYQELSGYDSSSDGYCAAMKDFFGEYNDFQTKGGMKTIGDSFARGMVLSFSLWDDGGTHMLWLDGTFPVGSDPNTPGVVRGPCGPNTGNPDEMHQKYADSYISYSNVKVGTIGSTFGVSD